MKAQYNRDGAGLAVNEFVVLKKNDEDGTVDIGPEGGQAVVTHCSISEDRKPGTCTLIPDGPEIKTKK